MAPLKAGDDFPEGVTFTYIPPAPETSEFSACGMPIKYNASKEFKNKKVVLFALPGAFTPTCSASHVPGYIAKFPELKAKGIDQVICLAYNDAFVMSGWGKANGVKDESIVFASDDGTAFSKEHAWVEGDRCNRYGMIIDHGKVIYSELEPHLQVSIPFYPFFSPDHDLGHVTSPKLYYSPTIQERQLTREPKKAQDKSTAEAMLAVL